jgi:glycosyltransferase involved in cell wall biosynthesis
MGQVEADICRRADLVFATAHNLVEKTEQFTSQVCYLPNGVDFHLFSTQPAQPPADLVDIPKPRLIYVGVIGAWFDFELVEFASQSLPGCSFVIIGPVEGGSHVQVGIEKLDRRDNIYLLGSRPFAQVPRYLNNSQVGLIPFVKNELTDSINPIKLFEYAAAGLPIVSRDLDETRALQSPALLYASPAEFIGGIQKALKDNNTLERAGREFGRRNSWRRRYRMIKNKLKLLGLEQGKEQCE